MNNVLTTAQLSVALPAVATADQPLPMDIQWMPPGAHTITPYVDGEPKELTIQVNEALAATMAARLRELWAAADAGRGDEPFFDFNHDEAAGASGHPRELYWAGEDPKLGGIRARMKDWTSAGEAALRGRVFRRFSPSWYSHPVTGAPVTIDANLGGLVNRAAFQTIQPVVARRGDQNQKQSTMTDTDKHELTQLITAGTAAAIKPLETRLAALETKASAAPAIPDALETRLKAVEAATGKTTAAQAKAAVAVHARRGAIPPQDADTLAFWEAQYQADPEKAERVLAKLPDNPALAAKMTTNSGGTSESAPAAESPEAFVAAVKAARAADPKLSKGAALTSAIASHPKAYEAWKATGSKQLAID